ncbi:putative leucine-rich repeat-containing protein DDB_G0290503 isoform X2 [Stegodyphus dumicola]|uniref:putative leucine-rich repeat-containing protein DDB_G0290503 isoform X2 n=1 Tax=Stegodyphus dumicola TaxID=202533 RepID=UPI0015A9ABF7|nr:putative leucine-rich repeat-containing protein DDB_G0290503 isoform X2 [Stegodyphus dumicola]
MAAFQFSVQQVSFTSEDFSLDASSVDSLSSVVDPNVDFITGNENTLEEKEIKTEWKSSKVTFSDKIKIMENKNQTSSVSDAEHVADKQHSSESITPSYPTIPLAVAHYINQNNPEFYQEAEKYLNHETSNKSAFDNVYAVQENNLPSSPLHSLSIATEALALQQSVIGNMGVKPVSADIVAQVVASTRQRLAENSQDLTSCDPSLAPLSTTEITNVSNIGKSTNKIKSEQLDYKESTCTSKLIRYPSESISSVVEKRPWFSSSSTEFSSSAISKPVHKNSLKKNLSHSNSSSQSSINSIGQKKCLQTNDIEMPKVHSSKKFLSKHVINSRVCGKNDSPYEMYPDSSCDYETESSVSEKFEVESLCSEAFETESNFSEISGIDDEIFQIRRTSDAHLINFAGNSNKDLKHNGTQVSTVTSHANTSPLKHSTPKHVTDTDEKATETDDSYHINILREKANLEGRLETIAQDQTDLIKERDHFSSLSTSYEAQLKALQKQLDVALSEKRDILKLLDLQTKEHKNWDNVIKEYQNIIESKNSEIKGLKEDLSLSEQANTECKISLEELKVDMESKDGAISGLKKKIAELHVEVQVHLQGKVQLGNELKNVRLEIETLQKSKDWFQEQLHIAQENRNKLHQDLISAQSEQAVSSNNLEKIIAEKNQLRQELIHTQQRAVAEKEVLMKRLETIEADMKERESLFDEIQKDKGTAESALVERIRKIEEEKSHLMDLSFTISDQEHQIKFLKSDCEEKAELLKSLEKERAELMKQVAVLHKSSNDKDLNIQQLTQQIKDMNIKLNHAEMALSHSEELIHNLKDEKTATDVALASVNEEKRVINESLKNVSENLNKFKHNFKHMKAELLTRTSQAEQLLKEKQLLEETIRKNEESVLLLRKEFEQQVLSKTQNRDVMFDDLQKKKNDVESVLNVYSKDLLNYQQTVENLSKQKTELNNEISELKLVISNKENKIMQLDTENESLKKKLFQFENNFNDKDVVYVDENSIAISPNEKPAKCSTEEYQRKLQVSRGRKILYKKLKEKMKECESLRKELELKSETQGNKDNCETKELASKYSQCEMDKAVVQNVQDLENQLKEQKMMLKEQTLLLKKSENTILELEKEKGKADGIVDKYNALKQRVSELELKIAERDSQVVELNCKIEELNTQISDLESSSKNQILSLESDLNKEKAVVKSLRQQVFQEKRANSHLQRDLLSLKSGLEQTNQIADSKKQEITALQSELSVKMHAELKHRAEIEHFQNEMRVLNSVIEKLNKELEEVKARDPALAEQLKALSWRLKEKTNEVLALQEKQNLIEDRHKSEIEGLRKILQDTQIEMERIKIELNNTRKEKFNYQSKVIELRKALKSKLAELESKGILRLENKTSNNGPVIHLNIPDPEVSFDESYVNSLLQKSLSVIYRNV